MKEIKVFLASGKEMKHDRNAFGNLIRKLDEIYEKRRTRIRLFEWEDVDSAYNGGRKQDEYNEHLKASDMFLALFHTYAGKFTVEEINIAKDERAKKGTPKPYVYCRDLEEGEQENQTLTEFKKELFENLGYYICSYNSEECLNLQFVMQLQLFENTQQNEVKVENNDVTFCGIKIAEMDNLQFVAQNMDYLKLRDEINELKGEIEDLHEKLEKSPDDESLKDTLQQKLNRKNKRQEEFTKYQQQILDIQKNIVKLQGEKISERSREAIEAFSQGDIRKAYYILEDAKKDTLEGLNDFISSKEITEQKRKNVCQNIKELLLRADVVLADLGKDIESRKKEAWDCYETADKAASIVDYNKKDYAELLFRYSKFLSEFAYFNEAKEIYQRLLSLCEEIFGCNEQTAIAYNNIGNVYNNLGNYDKALEYHNKALEIRKEVLGAKHPDTANSYNNIGNVYCAIGDYNKALDSYNKALEIQEKVLGEEHTDTASSYNNIGNVYGITGDYNKALEIQEKVLGEEHSDTTCSYNNIGLVYNDLGKYDEALTYHTKALKIREKVLGEEHTDTASSYNNIGNVYCNLSNYDEALKYHTKALEIYKKVLSEECPDTAMSYNNIGCDYYNLSNYDKALVCYTNALKTRKKVLGEKHTDTASSYNNIGSVYYNLGKYDEALEYYTKALEIYEKVLGKEHIDTAMSYNNIGNVSCNLGKYNEAFKYFDRALQIQEKVLGEEHIDTAMSYNNIGRIYAILGKYDKALGYFTKALKIFQSMLGSEHPYIKRIIKYILSVKAKQKQQSSD